MSNPVKPEDVPWWAWEEALATVAPTVEDRAAALEAEARRRMAGAGGAS